MSEAIRYEADESIVVITIDRPLVAPGHALTEAIALAKRLAELPQAALCSDRLSSYEQWSLGLGDALSNEYRHGMSTLATGEVEGGLARYASGDWRRQRGARADA